MPKKKSLEWRNCSEAELAQKIRAWAEGFDFRDTLIFLEGEMGAGKSTFARALLAVLAPSSRSMGSPTFPLVQEYRVDAGYLVYHIDLYRLKNDRELEDSGIESQIEEPGSAALVEWASLFEDAFVHWWDPARKRRKKVILVRIESSESGLATTRDVSLTEV